MSFQPQTPQSPSQFSPATSSDPKTAVAVTATTATTTASSGSSSTGPTNLPTPAHSVNGSISHPDSAMLDESPNKRKRAIDDTGDRDQKKMHFDDTGLGISELHLNVGEKYLLCQIPHPESLPRTSDDLYAMFNLTGLAAEVAREKPNGEKNALRKTYKGHIKRLGVAGHFDVQRKSDDAPSDFMAMLQVPELEWNVHEVKGREINDGLSEASLSALSRAMTMSKGPIPKTVWDTSVLGGLAPSNGGDGKALPTGKSTTAPGTPSATTPNPMPGNAAQLAAGQDPNRPRRNIKKRSYGDSSFEGYGEGFPDDDGGYSTGDGEAGQKRRKKDPSAPSPPYPAVRQHSYGPGMVGA